MAGSLCVQGGHWVEEVSLQSSRILETPGSGGGGSGAGVRLSWRPEAFGVSSQGFAWGCWGRMRETVAYSSGAVVTRVEQRLVDTRVGTLWVAATDSLPVCPSQMCKPSTALGGVQGAGPSAAKGQNPLPEPSSGLTGHRQLPWKRGARPSPFQL